MQKRRISVYVASLHPEIIKTIAYPIMYSLSLFWFIVFAFCQFQIDIMSSVCIILYSSFNCNCNNFINMTKVLFLKSGLISGFSGYTPDKVWTAWRCFSWGENPPERAVWHCRFVSWNLFYLVKQGGSRNYPAYFVKKADGTITFIGHLEKVQDLLDADSIEESILKEHPEIVTFTSYFKD